VPAWVTVGTVIVLPLAVRVPAVTATKALAEGAPVRLNDESEPELKVRPATKSERRGVTPAIVPTVVVPLTVTAPGVCLFRLK